MYILLAPAKTFNTNYQDSNLALYFNSETQELLNNLKAFSLDQLKDILKVSDTILKDVTNYLNNFKLSKRAISLYGGTVFKQLKIANYHNNSLNNVYIFSALYGLVNANSAISEYRLDFTNKILETSLYQFWGNKVNNFIKDNLNNQPIINLASQEFTNLIKEPLTNLFEIDFQIIKNNKITRPSQIVKTMRGLLTNYILENNLKAINELTNFNLNGFKYYQINNQTIIFRKEEIK